MEYTKKQFFADVKAEADALKENATKEQIKNLDLYWFNPHSKTSCVYGLMTGHCRSRAAVDLIKKCCIRYVKNAESLTWKNFSSIKPFINGSDADISGVQYLSAIESYIVLDNAKNKNLIAYIKGEVNELIL